MDRYLYFDSAATSAPCEQALAAVALAYREYANPSSVHHAGLAAKKLIDTSRLQLAEALRCEPETVLFTSSGTEASNQALFGLAKLRARVSRRIISTDSEHPSVEESLRQLEAQGFSVCRLSTKGGKLDLEQLREALSEPVAFLSVMRANNETGALYDIEGVRRVMNETGCDAPLHCDAVQSFLKEKQEKLTGLCDLITVSAHKIGGVKGAGALYISKRIRNLPPLLYGGGQEKGLRSGTENVAAIAAFGAAAKALSANKQRYAYLSELQALLMTEFERIGIRVHLPEAHLPNLLHISLPGVPSSWALNFLSGKGICVSAGSACSAREKKKGNRVLSAYGLSAEEIETSLRISFSETNTKEECACLCEGLQACLKLKR